MEGEEDAGRQITRKGVKVNSLANCERGGGGCWEADHKESCQGKWFG